MVDAAINDFFTHRFVGENLKLLHFLTAESSIINQPILPIANIYLNHNSTVCARGFPAWIVVLSIAPCANINRDDDNNSNMLQAIDRIGFLSSPTSL